MGNDLPSGKLHQTTNAHRFGDERTKTIHLNNIAKLAKPDDCSSKMNKQIKNRISRLWLLLHACSRSR